MTVSPRPTRKGSATATAAVAATAGSPTSGRRVKCVFVGDGAIGKTSLIVSYTTNSYPQKYVPTAFDTYSVVVRVDNQPIRLQLCDTAGQNDFDTLRPLCYPDTDVFLLCFSVIAPNTFYNLAQHWVPELRSHAPNVPLLLIGTQTDLRNNVSELLELSQFGESPVTAAEGREFAAEVGARGYVECSALTRHNLKDVFDAAILAALQPAPAACARALPRGAAGHLKKLKERLGRQGSAEDLTPAGRGCMPPKNALPACHSSVMLKRQLSSAKVAEAKAADSSGEAAPSAVKVSRLRDGWRRLLAFTKKLS